MDYVELDPMDNERLKEAVRDFVQEWCDKNASYAKVDYVDVDDGNNALIIEIGTHS